MSSRTAKYNPVTWHREFNTFIEEYYSGPDTSIVIGTDKNIQASSIQFGLQEQLKPIYGYTSHIFDDVAVGNRIIVGSITIPLTNKKDTDAMDFTIKENVIVYTQKKPGWKFNTSTSAYSIENNLKKMNVVNTNYLESNNQIKQYDSLVKEIQQVLLSLGYTVDINGYLDFRTQSALKQYQEDNSLNITGTLTDETKDKLLNNFSSSIIAAVCNLLNSPSENSNILAKLNEGTKVNIITKLNDYYYVETKNGLVGYIKGTAINVKEGEI